MKKRAKGLFYCRCPEGVTDLLRCLNICRGLVHSFDIDFLHEDSKFNLTLKSNHFRNLSQPQDEPIDPYNEHYDFFISEMFPFGKWECKEEVEGFISKLKAHNPKMLTICSLSDNIPSTSPENDRLSLKCFQKYFDFVFVHSDPRIYLLDESFSLVDELGDKLIYTGFTNNPDADITLKDRLNRIVVSTGSGRFGEKLIYASIDAATYHPQYQFAIVLGPAITPKVTAEIKFAAKKAGAENITLVPFVQNFQEFLSESALSISLGGYTIMDAACTKTPAIVLPLNFHDQQMRAMKFAAFGFIKLVTQDDLSGDRLGLSIKEALAMPSPAFEVDMDGSQTTCREIETRTKRT